MIFQLAIIDAEIDSGLDGANGRVVVTYSTEADLTVSAVKLPLS